MLDKKQQLPQTQVIDTDYFIYCLEAVEDEEIETVTETQNKLDLLTSQYGVASIYNTCDSIEGLESNLNALVLDDHNFNDYEIIYLVIQTLFLH